MSYGVLLVHLLRAYSNREDLLSDLTYSINNLQRALKSPARKRRSVISTGRVQDPKLWKLQDLLSKDQTKDIIVSFMAGTPKHVLAARHGVGKSSIEKVLRQHGVKRKSRRDIRPEDLPEWIKEDNKKTG